MTTKKQKRLKMQGKRQSFEADLRASGLLAQKRDREYRARKAAKAEGQEEAQTNSKNGRLATKTIKGGKKGR